MKWVLGILAVVVIVFVVLWLNAYKERFDVVRATIAGAANELAVARDEVTTEFARTKAMPAPRDFPTTTKNVRSLRLEPDGRLVATLSSSESPSAAGKHIVYESRVAGTNLEWRCTSPDIDRKLLPAGCR